jgi:hypothetical protein
MACSSEQSLKQCTCSFTSCDKRGNCCKCVAYHLDRGEIPGCFFTEAGERSYDRSLANLARDRNLL